jgi:hypothetical protein
VLIGQGVGHRQEHGDERVVAEELAAGVVVIGGGEVAEGGVHCAFPQGGGLRPGREVLHVYLRLRSRAVELGQGLTDARQVAGRQIGMGQAKLAAASLRASVLDGLERLLQGGSGVLNKDGSRGRQASAAGASFKELDAELALEVGDLSGEGLLCQAQTQGGAGKAAGVGYRDGVPEVSQFQDTLLGCD